MTEYERLMDLLMSDRVQYEHIMSEKGDKSCAAVTVSNTNHVKKCLYAAPII